MLSFQIRLTASPVRAQLLERLNQTSLRYNSHNAETCIEAPLRKYRSPTSVLRCLAACVQPDPNAVEYHMGSMESLTGSSIFRRTMLRARANGRMAARMAIREYFPGDVINLATEIPRIDRLLPIVKPDDILKAVDQKRLSPSEGMDRLVSLFAPKHAWKLYKKLAPDENWDSDTLHRLLDLLCATNCGVSVPGVMTLNFDLSTLPDADEYCIQGALPFLSQLSTFSTQSSTTENGSDDSESATQDYAKRWSLTCPAEELFKERSDILCTPEAYCSMIRGCAKFRDSYRAMDLASQAWELHGDDALDVPTYALLLRNMHHSRSYDIWPGIRVVVQHLISSRQTIDSTIFSSIILTLSNWVWRGGTKGPSKERSVVERYRDICLSLLNELRQLGLEPDLGVMANTLKLLRGVEQNLTESHTQPSDVNASQITASFVEELHRRFKTHPPNRADLRSMDDFNFFTSAMRTAAAHHDPALAIRINDLFCGSFDCRFLVEPGTGLRMYATLFAKVIIDSYRDGLLDVEATVHQLDHTHRLFGTELLGSSQIVTPMFLVLDSILKSNNSDKVKKFAHELLCNSFTDFVIHSRTFRAFSRHSSVPVGLNILGQHSSIHPFLSAEVSARVLALYTQPPGPLMDISASMLRSLVELTLPAVASSGIDFDSYKDRMNLSGNQPVNASNTLEQWLSHATERKHLSWEWTPAAIQTIFQAQANIPYELIWDMLYQLSSSDAIPLDPAAAATTLRMMNPVLDALETNLNPKQIGVMEKQRQCLNRIRQMFSDAKPMELSSGSATQNDVRSEKLSIDL